MSKSAETKGEAITCVIPVHNVSRALERAVNGWVGALNRLGREHEILIVNDGSTDDTTEIAHTLAAKIPAVRVLTHDTRRGYGASLRTALAEAKHPLFFYTAIDPAYAPTNLKSLLERILIKDEITGMTPVLVSGARTGGKRPAPVQMIGGLWRFFCRVVLGLPLMRSPVWLGSRETAYSYLVWGIFGVPLADPNSAFKLWRTDFLRRFPIQSSSDFVHVELVAKATFLTTILDEVPLSPTESKPERLSVWRDFWRVLKHPDFGVPLGVTLKGQSPPPDATPVATPETPPATEPPTPPPASLLALT